MWAREYNRELKDLLNLQSEIAQEVGPEIRTAVGDIKPKASAPLPPAEHDYEAYEMYLEGEYFLGKRTVPDFRKAIAYFRKATDRDPDYARAYAGLGVWTDNEAENVAEYAAPLAVILVIVVGTIRLIGSQAYNVFSQTASAIGSS